MSMSKKDYVALAKEIKETISFLEKNGHLLGVDSRAAVMLAKCISVNVLKPSNPLYDERKFLAACGITD